MAARADASGVGRVCGDVRAPHPKVTLSRLLPDTSPMADWQSWRSLAPSHDCLVGDGLTS